VKLSKNSGSAGRRIAVIGLDGTPFSFLRKEIDAGNLPNLANMQARGKFLQMETEIPTVSSVAWASFMTGKNPAEHGIFGFTDRKPGTYETYFPNYSDLKAEPVWNSISSDGGRCCVINVPSTYPARALNGVLVSGFVAPNLERASYPAETFEYLSRVGYRIDVDASRARESLDALVEDLHVTTEKRREAMFHYWQSEPWDMFMCVFTGTDRLHHFLWKHYETDDPVYAAEFIRYYQRIDEIIGEFVSELPDDVSMMMLSDHGFCSLEKEVYLNAFLREKGYLALKTGEPRMISDMDSTGTKAYCMDPGRIYLNLEGREPGGIVSSADAAGLCDEITQSLLALLDPDTGETVIERVVTREEIFHGPLAALSPDLVAVPRNGYDLKGTMAKEEVWGNGLLTGMHTHDDAFLWIQNGADSFGSGEKPHIRQVEGLIRKARA